MARIALVILAFLLVGAVPAQARIQRDFVCWVPDCEFPVDCDDDDD